MMHVVQEMDAEAVLFAQRVEQLRREVEILFRRPDLFLGQALAGRLVKKLAPGDAISRLQSGHARLGPHCLVAELEIMGDGVDRSEEGRVGKECVRTFRTGWSPY